MCLATGAETIDWVGTSVGGLIGMVLAGLPGSRIRRLVINDIGPTVPVAAEARIGEKLVDMPKAFKTFDEAVAFYCSAFPDYGELDDTCWRHIARHSIEWSETEQKFRLLFDRGIIWAYHFYRYYSMPLWPFWRNIRISVLILAGEKSDFLPLSLAVEMQTQNPRARIVRIPGARAHAHAHAIGPDRSCCAVSA